MPDIVENSPSIWRSSWPPPKINDHKYDRGHALILAAPELTGATRLATLACSRIGAGLTTVLANVQADIYRTTLPPDIMVREDAGTPTKVTVCLGGPGGITTDHRHLLYESFDHCPRVFDADALPHVEERHYLDPGCVLTPHEGEFARAFPELTGSRTERAVSAANLVGCTIVLKGSETVIARPAGTPVINRHASPYLAKAGTGDVLAGMIAGLIAQKMPPFEASCAAVWMHGEAARRIGIGLMASDIENQLPAIMRDWLTEDPL